MSASLVVDGVCIDRGGKRVVRDVSFDVDAGEVVALLGPNGAGKSSLVLGIAGVLRIAAGRVVADGVDISGRAPHQVRAAGVAAVPEGHRVLSDLSVLDNLRAAGGKAHERDLRSAVDDALDVLPELRERLGYRAGALSGGQQQMVALAQAMVSRPKFLLVDELSLGLAPIIVSRLVPVLRQLAERGVGVLLIEQFATVALGVADRAVVMGHGHVGWSGPASDLAEHPEILHGAYFAKAHADEAAGEAVG